MTPLSTFKWMAGLLLSLVAIPIAAARRRAVTPPSSSDASLAFVFDSGFRVLNGANPAAGVAPNGDVYLYYNDVLTGKMMRVMASDGLKFSNANEATTFAYDSRNTLMPDGKTWRRYQADPRTGAMTSSRSTDGASFTQETIVAVPVARRPVQWSTEGPA